MNFLCKIREFLKESWKKRKMSHLREFLDCTRQVSRLVATCLVSENDKEKRIQLLTKFLDVAQGLFSNLFETHKKKERKKNVINLNKQTFRMYEFEKF